MSADIHSEVVSLVRAGRVADADALVADALDAGDDSVTVLRAAAHVAFAAGDDLAARNWMDRARASPDADWRVELERAQLFAACGDRPAAIDALQALVANTPGADAWALLGRLLYEARRETEAADAFHAALLLRPDDVGLLRGRAESLFAAERHDEAQAAFSELARLLPDDADVALRLARSRARAGHVQEGVDAVTRLKARFGARPQFLMAEGLMREDLGDRDGARAAYAAAADAAPTWAEPISAALMLDHAAPRPDVLDKARALAADARLEAGERAYLHYALGKVADSQGRHAEAWRHWEQANLQRRSEVEAEPEDALARRMGLLRELYTPDFVAALAAQAADSPGLVLVVGMPRSGTTLVERVLGVHAQVACAGEATALPMLHASVAERVRAATFQPGESASLGRAYVDALRTRAGGAADVIVDKQPYNFMFLGLAAGIVPRARMVWCRRDPRDVAVSIFSENFASHARYATDLADIHALQHAQEALMEHWRDVLGIDVLPVEYEAFVTDFEAQARRLVEFVGLPWDPRCLDFHASAGQVQTNSRWQVREPVNTRSVGRWRHHRDALAAAGYAVDEG